MFGQVGGAQTHLKKSGVGVGDLFLFFGWFRQAVHLNGRLTYDTKAPHLHVIFGWLQVGRILKPTVNERGVPKWATAHPHVDGAKQKGENNTIYVAAQQLRLPGLRRKIPGGGIFSRFTPPLRLTAEGERRSVWRLPRWFYPAKKKPALTHHSDLGRWKRDPTGVLLQTVSKGQEFVLDCNYYPEAITWLHDIFAGVA